MLTATCQSVAYELFILYCRFVNWVSRVSFEFYKNNEIVMYLVDETNYMIKLVVACINNYRIEPNDKMWICTSMLIKRDNPSFFFGETYSYVEYYDIINTTISNNMNDSYTLYMINDMYKVTTAVAKKHNSVESMVTVLRDNKYLFLISSLKDELTLLELESLKSNVVEPCLLSIEYIHPKMKKRIVLYLSKNMYINNNAILSPIFVKRLLEHQSEKYVFDMEYTLTIMDNNIKVFTINSGQYIKLKDITYEIRVCL